MAHRQRRTGRLLSVWEPTVGTTLEADAAAGATSITVDDASVFDESGGSLYIGTQVARYSDIDDEIGVVTLVDALSVDAEADDPVVRWSTLYDEVETVQMAQVAVEGDRDQGDTLTCEVADTLDLPTGDRSDDGENCVIERDGDVWTVISARGRPSKARGIKFESAEPVHTPSTSELAAGSFTHELRHQNIEGLTTTINGEDLEPEWWTLDAAAGVVTVTIPDWVLDAPEAHRGFGWPMYAYRRGVAVEVIEEVVPPPPEGVRVPFTVVGTRVARGFDWTAVGWPVGTQDADLFLFAQLARTALTNVCTDARATLAASGAFSLDTGKIWVGTVTDAATPLAAAADNGGGVEQDVYALIVLRPDSPIDFDLSRVSDSGAQAGGAGTIPALTGSGSGAVGVGFSMAGIGGTTSHGWGGATDWTVVTSYGTYGKISLAVTDAETPADTPAVSATDPWRGFIIGLGLG